MEIIFPEISLVMSFGQHNIDLDNDHRGHTVNDENAQESTFNGAIIQKGKL